jgi:nicotinamide phosphoribosyltransferase
MAHLVNFQGTDTMEALLAARRYYDADIAGFSIPAAEHSTITSWGRARGGAYRTMLDAFDGAGRLVAVVSDSYDLDAAVRDIWGGSLRAQVLGRQGTLVVRPDSGDPIETPLRTIAALWEAFGGTVNAKGFRVLDPHVRVIQGDGMTLETIGRLIDRWSRRLCHRQHRFRHGRRAAPESEPRHVALCHESQCHARRRRRVARRVQNPATDPAKASKAGRQAVVLRDGPWRAARCGGADAAGAGVRGERRTLPARGQWARCAA